MSYTPLVFTALCKRVRKNNGIVEVLLTRQSDYADKASQESHVLLNAQIPEDQFVEGKQYWVEFRPAFPKQTKTPDQDWNP